MDLRQDREHRKGPAAQLPRISSKELPEGIRSPRGTVLAAAIVDQLRDIGIEAVVSPLGMGYAIRAKGGEAYVQDCFMDDKDGEARPGARITVQSLRLPWFRKALEGILRCRDESALYEELVNKQFFLVPWGSEFYVGIIPEDTFDAETLRRLGGITMTAKTSATTYQEYFREAFAKELPKDFKIGGAFLPQVWAASGKGLRSIVENDSGYRKAIEAAKKVAMKIIEEGERDIDKFSREINAEAVERRRKNAGAG